MASVPPPPPPPPIPPRYRNEIKKELEAEYFLEQLKLLNAMEIKDIKKSTSNAFELFIKFVLTMLESEEEQIQAIGQPEDFAPAESLDPESNEPLSSSKSAWEQFTNFLGNFGLRRNTESGEDAAENDDNDDDNVEEHKSETLNLIPVFAMSALLVKEMKKFNSEFEKMTSTLNELKLVQEKLLDAQKDGNAVQKGIWIIKGEKLAMEREKIKILKRIADKMKPVE